MEEILMKYFESAVAVIGFIQFFKGVKEKGFDFNRVMQVIACMIVGAFYAISFQVDAGILKMAIAGAWQSLIVLAITTLGYDLIVKRLNTDINK